MSREILFGRIYEQLSPYPAAKAALLEALEPYILSDQLSSVAPAVMQDFVEHYKEKGRVQAVEACIVHLDIASLDLNQVI